MLSVQASGTNWELIQKISTNKQTILTLSGCSMEISTFFCYAVCSIITLTKPHIDHFNHLRYIYTKD